MNRLTITATADGQHLLVVERRVGISGSAKERRRQDRAGVEETWQPTKERAITKYLGYGRSAGAHELLKDRVTILDVPMQQHPRITRGLLIAQWASKEFAEIRERVAAQKQQLLEQQFCLDSGLVETLPHLKQLTALLQDIHDQPFKRPTAHTCADRPNLPCDVPECRRRQRTNEMDGEGV